MRFENICVLGLGYIGLPTASTFATHGAQVTGVDVNARVVEMLQGGEIHIHEPGLRTLVRAALKSGHLTIQQQPTESDAFVIAVPTPIRDDKTANLDYVIAAAESIVPVLRKENLIVLESTSPPRTTVDIVTPILEQSGLRAGEDFHLVYSPERVLPGKILQELIENARVVGGVNSTSAQAGKALYQTFVRGEIIVTDATTAEMVKLMENTYRDINIAVANEFSRLADRFGVDAWEAIQLANLHPRVNILQPGPGVGGHCISVDPWFFVQAAPDLTDLIHMARQVNDAQPDFVVSLAERALGGLAGKRIAVLGLAYKPNVDDLRESPAIEVAHQLVAGGAQVNAFEPYKTDAKIPGLTLVPTLDDAVRDVDAVLLLVAHKPFVSLAPAELAMLTSARVLIDTVNGWSGNEWVDSEFAIYRLGVGKRPVV